MDIRDIYKNFVELENKDKEQLTEASMNISMNGQNASEIEQLMQLFKNAGMDAPKMDMPLAPKIMPAPKASPCGAMEDEVGEDWDNEPDPEYKDDNYMTGDMGDDLHRKKDRKAIRTTQPALESEIKEALLQALNEKKQTCNECGKPMLTAQELKELEELEEGERHGNSKIYDKCWKGCRKVAGKKRGEPGSCKCD